MERHFQDFEGVDVDFAVVDFEGRNDVVSQRPPLLELPIGVAKVKVS